MSLKRRTIARKVRRLDEKLKRNSWNTYQSVLELFVEDSPVSVSDVVYGFLQAKDYLSLIDWADSHGGAAHSTALEAYNANQLAALIKKYPFPIPNREEKSERRALDKFLAAERQCGRYNLKLRTYKDKYAFETVTLQKMADYIYHVIGEKPDLRDIYSKCSFGPGASIGIHGNSTNLMRKLLAEEWTCTPSALPYAAEAISTDHHLYELILHRDDGFVDLDPLKLREEFKVRTRLVHYNKITTVPKTVLVDRTIAVEPLWNGYLQKGVDEVLRHRLKRIGIDLRDQTRNQDLARQGSIPGQADPYVTIDLSNASDSISTSLVKRILPPEWFSFLNSIRSPAYMLPNENGETRTYEKFVSMGNGFCFPLETLIFASVCRLYAKPKDFSVYGDDIICRQSVARKVLKVLWRIGFRHNVKKTFLEGPFRESCGADWYEGRNIRPVTLDDPLNSLSEIIKFYNLSRRHPLSDVRFSSVREYLETLVPRELFMCRPYQGNIYAAFEVELDKFQSSVFALWNRETYSWSWMELDIKGVPDKGLRDDKRFPTALQMAALRGSSSRQPFSYRRKTTQYVRRMSYAGASSTWLPPFRG